MNVEALISHNSQINLKNEYYFKRRYSSLKLVSPDCFSIHEINSPLQSNEEYLHGLT